MTDCPSRYTFRSDATGQYFYTCMKPEGHKIKEHCYLPKRGEVVRWTDKEADK